MGLGRGEQAGRGAENVNPGMAAGPGRRGYCLGRRSWGAEHQKVSWLKSRDRKQSEYPHGEKGERIGGRGQSTEEVSPLRCPSKR